MCHEQEPRTGNDGDGGVDDSRCGHEDKRRDDHCPAVKQDLLGDVLFGGDHREHGNTGSFVVLFVSHRQRPGVRRRPEEDDQEQHDGLPAQRPGDSGPAHEDGHTSGCATPDDVLPGTTLENHRVDEDVKRDRDHDEDAGQEVGSPPQPQERRESEKEPEDERVTRRHRLAGQRTLRRALHDLVDVGVDDRS